jgi:SAM-dependent methyltransferase
MARKLTARIRNRLGLPPSFGDLGDTAPVSRHFGFDRGTPVDRYYVEHFLARHASRITGRTLEIGDDSYTARFGGDRTSGREVLHIDPAHPATYHGDLASPGILPPARFDCAVVTQTLHLIFNMHAALGQLHAALKPGGTLLLTVPGITPIAGDEWGDTWYWSLTRASLTRLVDEVFGPGQASLAVYGNVFAATAFLQGLAYEEVPLAKLDLVDPLYPVTVAACAVKRSDG